MVNKIVLIFGLMVFFLPVIVYSEKLNAYVTDNANLLTLEEERLLTEKIELIENATGYEIVIVTVPTTNGDDRFFYAYNIGEGNGVGKASTDNGIVVLWSVEDEHGGAIATGRGAEVAVTDADVNRIGRASREYFDADKFYGGFKYILAEIAKEINQEDFANAPSNNPDGSNNLLLWVVIGLLIMWGLGLGFFASSRGSYESTSYSTANHKTTRSRRRRKDDDDDAFIAGAVIGSSIGSSSHDDDSSSGWSNSGSSFSGFGGGSFGGGGGGF